MRSAHQQQSGVDITGTNPLALSVMDRNRFMSRWKIPFSW
jgi:hypothetical protein